MSFEDVGVDRCVLSATISTCENYGRSPETIQLGSLIVGVAFGDQLQAAEFGSAPARIPRRGAAADRRVQHLPGQVDHLGSARRAVMRPALTSSAVS